MHIHYSVANWTLLYSAELLSFSIVLLFLIKSELRRPIAFWIMSNLLAALAMLTPSTFVEVSSSANPSTISFFCSAASNWLVYYVASYGQKTSVPRLVVFLVILSLWLVGLLLPFGWLSLLIAYSGGTLLSLVSGWAALKNPIWRGLWGHRLLVIGFLICASLILWRGLVVFAHKVGDGFYVDADDSALGMRLLVFTSFVLQIAFVSVIIGWEMRQRRSKDREAAQEIETSRSIEAQQRQMQLLADERLDMISLLTHEVRQPINNAQAALQALKMELRACGTEKSEIWETASRAQSVLDAITLSISNAILGVSLIDRNQTVQTQSLDAMELAKLARSDCPAEQRRRISLSSSESLIFVQMDPILIRLALRNLLDNALKYSKPNTQIQLTVGYDDKRFGVSFKVTNAASSDTVLNEDIFGHRVRGRVGQIEGSGHGLFLVKKVADAHHGDVSFEVAKDGRVTFDLFIPD